MDAVVVKIEARTGRLAWATRTGGSSWDAAGDLTVARGGPIYVLGSTRHGLPDYPRRRTTPLRRPGSRRIPGLAVAEDAAVFYWRRDLVVGLPRRAHRSIWSRRRAGSLYRQAPARPIACRRSCSAGRAWTTSPAWRSTTSGTFLLAAGHHPPTSPWLPSSRS